MPEPPTVTGGPGTFRHHFTRFLTSRGHTVVARYVLNADVLLATPACSLIYASYTKLRGTKIVQRLDGVYHSALPGMRLGRHRLKNLRLKLLHNYLADHVVYQSEFSRLACTTMLGKRHASW